MDQKIEQTKEKILEKRVHSGLQGIFKEKYFSIIVCDMKKYQ